MAGRRPKLIPKDTMSKTRPMPVAGAVPPVGTPGPLKALDFKEGQAALEARVANDERPVTRLVKRTFAVMGQPAEARKIALASLTAEISSTMVSIARMQRVAQVTSKTEQETYEQDLKSFEDTKNEGDEQIAKLKEGLKAAQQERDNKLEYDGYAKRIAKYSARRETEELMRRTRSQIEALREESEGYRDIASRIREKWVSAMETFGTLQNQISSEIAERERAAVQRQEQLGDEEDEEVGATAEGSTADPAENGVQALEDGEEGAAQDGGQDAGSGARDEEEEEGVVEDVPHQRTHSNGSSSRLNPGAAPFEPSRSARRARRDDDDDRPLPKRPRM